MTRSCCRSSSAPLQALLCALLACAALICASYGCASTPRAGAGTPSSPPAGAGPAESREKAPPAAAEGTVPPPGAGSPSGAGTSSGAEGSGSAGEGGTAGSEGGTTAARPGVAPPATGAGMILGSVATPPSSPDASGVDGPENPDGAAVPRTGGTAATQGSPDPGRGAAGVLALRLVASPAVPRVGDQVTVEVRASSVARVVDAPLHLTYDATRLRYVTGEEGTFLSRDGSGTVFLINGRSLPGVVTIGLGRLDRAHGLGGTGTHCRVRFEVIAPGTSRVAVGQAMAWADDGSMLKVETGAVEISVPEP